MDFRISPIESRRFGIKVARCESFVSGDWPDLVARCDREVCDLAIIRCSGADTFAAQELIENGCQLTDMQVTLGRSLADPIEPEASEAIAIRAATRSDAGDIERIARSAFDKYLTHYRANPHLDPDRITDGMVEWAMSFLEITSDREILLADLDGSAVGFAAMAAPGEDAEGVLNAVAPEARQRGVHRQLLYAGMQWGQARGCHLFTVRTQLHNLTALRNMVRVGLVPIATWYAFHRMFNAVTDVWPRPANWG